ncbi:hypothetical protein [Paraburkholderia nemoris]|uniref:hypothetical protein n=1 Tax=Paraburkholderia nemoris TaxID=2793076 RepID=UPI001F295895|nr:MULTISPECIES: hypothetical protein [Paraburkholderia]
MSSTRRGRRRVACPKIGALMRYGERVVRVVAEARDHRVTRRRQAGFPQRG